MTVGILTMLLSFNILTSNLDCIYFLCSYEFHMPSKSNTILKLIYSYYDLLQWLFCSV